MQPRTTHPSLATKMVYSHSLVIQVEQLTAAAYSNHKQNEWYPETVWVNVFRIIVILQMNVSGRFHTTEMYVFIVVC